MKLPLSWLTELVDLDLGVDELVRVMSAHGLEVEDVTTPGAGVAGIVTSRVVDWQPHPDADKLRVVQVTDGCDVTEVVCGAANFSVGDVVAHARPGGFVPGVDAGGGRRGLTLEARAIRGVSSQGMLASPRELEIGDDHAGILLLPADTPLGVELTELVPFGEPVIEIAVQPDRGDHLGVLGVARDLAAILDTTWRTPTTPSLPSSPTVPVQLRTPACAAFHTALLSEVTVAPSPLWVRQRLAQCGVRSIDVVVDATNLAMLEVGQPLHAFDHAELTGPLTVSAAVGGERLTTLDDRERVLEPGDVMISDADRPVSLAGVMGGADTEVRPGTREVLLEAAVWEPKTIRRTSRRLGLVSEASTRYERGVDPNGAALGLARAAGVIAEATGAVITGVDAVVAEPTPTWAARPAVRVDPRRLRRLIALDLDDTAQRRLLERAGCVVDDVDGDLEVTPPGWRWDLTRPADVAEEVARLHGYDEIPATLPRLDVTGGYSAQQRLADEALAAALAAGFHEAVTRPFVGGDALVGLAPSDGRVRLANPLAQDASAMRPSLVEGLLAALRRNHGQGRPGTALVEVGRLFRPVDDPLADVLDRVIDADWRWRSPDGSALPVQPRTLALAAQGLRHGPGWLDTSATWSVEDVLAVLDEVVRRLTSRRSPGAVLARRPVERDGLHPFRTAVLLLDGEEVGVVGQLHPTEAAGRDLPDPVVVGELLLEPFLQAVPEGGHEPVRSAPLIRHPALTVDVALSADEAVPYAELEAAVRRGAGDVLDEVWFFDEYRGEQVGEGRRSVAMRLRLHDPDRQLTDEDAERVIGAVAAEAEDIGARLRR